ncbi:MAG: CPBP family intramembrane metalloprotease [Coriobacteriia bacterium]|nr:CPBP family intramembrane metalloprotease [Coriobacteriia bacterium]
MPWGEAEALGIVLLTIALLLGTGGILALPAVRHAAEAAPELVRGSALALNYALLVGVVWYAARRRGQALAPAVGLRRVSIPAALGLGAVVAFAARLAIIAWVVLLGALGIELPGEGVDITRLLPFTPAGVAVTVALAAVVAPVAEEIVFRGVLVTALARKRSEATAFVVSAALFAALHFNAFTLVPIFMLGVALAWLFLRTRTLWIPIAAHSVFNLVAVMAAYGARAAQ